MIKQITQHPERQYLHLIGKILKYGTLEKTRNGYTRTLIGHTMRFPLENDEIPILTTKKMAWKSCLKELLWFIDGDTDNETLTKQGVTIWNGNASREFLDSRKLYHLEENDLGPIYGYQWRNFNMPYKSKEVYKKQRKYTDIFSVHHQHIDQLQDIIDTLKCPKSYNSRRMIMTAWNPCQLDQMALPPCHVLSQFNVLGGKLYCSLYQRSADVGLGLPFNIASYAFLTKLLAHHCNLEPGEFIHHLGNAHIYAIHENPLSLQILRNPKPFPKLYFKNKYSDINKYKFSDFIIKDYKYHPKIQMKMIA